MLLPRSRVYPYGSLYGLPMLLVSIATLCHVHFSGSPHTGLLGFHFVIGC
ncbi:unnamed protein product [Staurois parvus]|uniref:Uncharacterized protein n=1 Tax=Staurois parvus TaxID=386267 RepID=A0ABN9AZL0_9NEOB|nr:unnamed protein product [Staurois parvus]